MNLFKITDYFVLFYLQCKKYTELPFCLCHIYYHLSGLNHEKRHSNIWSMENSDVHRDQPLRERVLALFSLSLDPLPFHLPSFFLPSGTQVTLFSSGPELYFCVSDFIVTQCTHPPDSRPYRKTFQRN